MTERSVSATQAELLAEVESLRQRLQEAEDTLQAIRSGEIDALLVAGETGDQVFTLKGADHGYRLFVEGMHEGAVTLRADGLILHCNVRFASLLGAPLSKVIGADFKSFVRDEQAEEIKNFLEAKLDRRREFDLISSTGEFIPAVLAISADLVEEASGGMCLIVTDIREQKHLEQLQKTQAALEQSQNQLKLALETARLGSWQIDFTTGEMTSSPQCLANFGLPPDFHLSAEAHDRMIHPDDREVWNKAVEHGTQPGAVFECEYRIICPDGSTQWIIASGRVLRGDDGAAQHMVGVVLNNTIRKQAEDSLRESENRFRTLAEAIPQLSWATHPTGECEYLSQQWIDYTGVPLEAQLGYGWLEVLHPDDRERTAAVWHKAVETGGDYDLEFRIRGVDEKYRWFKTRGTPLRDDAGKIIRWFGTCTEIEDIVQARQILDRDKAQLEALVKLRTASLNDTTEQLNSFCYSIAHDLRAPLRAQQGYARIILEDYGDKIGESGKRFAERIVTAAEKLEKLVQDLLSHVSVSRGDLPTEKVEIATVVAQVRADLGDAIKQAKAHIELGTLDGTVLGHEASLNLIVANLVSNALKYTKPGEPAQVRIWSEMRDAKLRLWVEDHGIGIKPEYHEKIFGVFERLHTSEAYLGTGIGLALVRKGSERMGGSAGVESEFGVGSRFWVELPRVM